jgi:polysaccharide pyruvyl transferase WcaK-like protein
MNKHYLIYGHGGSYNHGAEALARTTIALLREISPGCKITLSTHFADQDREFALLADEYIERSPSGNTTAEIYAPTIEKMTPDTICIHIGGDNYCYKNWQRWAVIHYAALNVGARSILWSCSIDCEMLDDEMLVALRSHHLITARESITYDALTANGLANVVQVSDIAFTLEPEQVDFELENYVVLNVSPLIVKRNPVVLQAYQSLLDYILVETDMNIALVPHVVQPVDNDYDALRSLNYRNPARVKLASDKLSAGQYKTIIGKARFCVAARTHAAIAAYSSNVPTLAVGYSAKSVGIAGDLGMGEYVVEAGRIASPLELLSAFKAIMGNESSIRMQLEKQMPRYVKNSINGYALECIK